jgi:hypothetical protein
VPRATIAVEIPESAWIRSLSEAYPAVTFRVVAVQFGAETGVVLLEFESPSAAGVVADVEGHSAVERTVLLWSREQTTLLQVETTDPQLMPLVREAGVPLRTPFEITEGTAIWDLTVSTDRLSDLGDTLEDAGVEFELQSVRNDAADSVEESLLTDRQREVLLAAADAGYYSVPREATLTEVAASLGISKATGSEVLHRAEAAIVSWFIEEFLHAAVPPEP